MLWSIAVHRESGGVQALDLAPAVGCGGRRRRQIPLCPPTQYFAVRMGCGPDLELEVRLIAPATDRIGRMLGAAGLQVKLKVVRIDRAFA
jgi:hypothetical protein